MNWQLPKIGGTKETVKAKVDETKLDQDTKSYITSQVVSLPDTASIITVTGYSVDHQNPMHTSAVTRNIQITISSAEL